MSQNPPGKSKGGVLQIPAAATQKNANTASKRAPRPAAPRLKLLVRRLPPGLTEAEFENAMGVDWKIGAGKVEWAQYKPGKISKDPAKPSRPSRAYIRVASSDYIAPLSEKIQRSSFLDARNTVNDPVLLGPPSLEFAPFAKVPGSRVRRDARQGTIDQDPDFIAFLESLTQPITKPATAETTTAEGEEKQETTPVTPLIQYIREKKVNKAKESTTPAKTGKHGKAEKESKPEKGQTKKKLLQRTDKEQPPSPQPTEKKSKADKAAKDAVRVANKQAFNTTAKSGSKPPPPALSTTTQNTTKEKASPGPNPDRSKRERADASAAVRIVQRELAPALNGGGRRRGGKGASVEADAPKVDQPSSKASTTAEASKKETASKKSTKRGNASPSSNTNSTTTAKGSSNASHQTENGSLDAGVSAATRPAPAPAPARPPPKSTKGKQTPAPTTPQATQAFLKHANPSQGITEPILESTFKTFGKISKVEIDRKKGFGYIDFAEPEGLQKAISASPVSVAQGQVVVLERKFNPGADRARGKGRNETPASNSNNNNNTANNSNSRGGKGSGSRGKGSETAAAGGGSASASRGSRGGRGGPKNRSGGSKNGGGSNTTATGEKTGGSKE